jgi:hypothetical protein
MIEEVGAIWGYRATVKFGTPLEEMIS